MIDEGSLPQSAESVRTERKSTWVTNLDALIDKGMKRQEAIKVICEKFGYKKVYIESEYKKVLRERRHLRVNTTVISINEVKNERVKSGNNVDFTTDDPKKDDMTAVIIAEQDVPDEAYTAEQNMPNIVSSGTIENEPVKDTVLEDILVDITNLEQQQKDHGNEIEELQDTYNNAMDLLLDTIEAVKRMHRR